MEEIEEGIKNKAKVETINGLLMQAYTNLTMKISTEKELEELASAETPDDKLMANKRMEIRTHQHNYDMQVRFAKILIDYK